MLTGQREAVIARLSIEEVHDSHLEIDGLRNKSGQRILVPLPQTAQEQVKKLGSTDGQFIVSTTKGLKPISGFSKRKKKIDTLSGVTNWRFHDIRRGLATYLEDNGIDRFYIERILTHKDRSVTGIYAKSNHLEKRMHIMEQWAKVLTSDDGVKANNIIHIGEKIA